MTETTTADTSTRAGPLDDGRAGAPGAGPSTPQAGGSALAATTRALRIVVLVWSAAWLALMGLSGGVGDSDAPVLSWAMLGALLVGWLVIVVARLPVTGVAVAALAVTALVQAGLSAPQDVWSQSSVVITWTNLAALTCGLVCTGVRGRIAIGAIAGGQLVVLSTVSLAEGSFGLAWRGILAAAAYALADGMAAHVAGAAVRAQARDTDAAADQLARERGLHAAREAETREVERVARVLHDTVLNTLGAVRRGVAPADVDALRARCAQDLVELRRMRDRSFDATGSTGVFPERIVRSLASRAEVLALALVVDARISSPEPLPTQVGDAVHGACSEALNNVARHSGVRRARFSLAWDGAQLDVSVADDGRGWSGEVADGHGVSRSILDRAEEAGVEALVATAPERGTTVSLSWRTSWHDHDDVDPADVAATAAAARAEPASDPRVDRALARVAFGAGAWVSLALVMTTLLFGARIDLLASLVALAVVAAVLRLGWVVGVRRGDVPLSWPIAALLVVATFFVTALPARAAGTCEALTEGWWGPDGAVVVLLALVLLTRGWWWTLAGSAAMVLGAMSLYVRDQPFLSECETFPAVNAAIELTVVLAMVIFREALLRQWARASEARALADDLRIAVDVREATEHARDARLGVAIADAVPLLDTLALAIADPADPVVRRQCGHAEGTLRALLVLGPAHDPLRALIADAVLSAYAAGRTLHVMPGVAEVPPPPTGAVGPLRALVDAMVGADPLVGDDAVATTVSVVRTGSGGTLTLVRDGGAVALPPDTLRALRESCTVEVSQIDDETLVEVAWP